MKNTELQELKLYFEAQLVEEMEKVKYIEKCLEPVYKGLNKKSVGK